MTEPNEQPLSELDELVADMTPKQAAAFALAFKLRDEEKPAPTIPPQLSAMVKGRKPDQAAAIGAAHAGQMPEFIEQQRQSAATNLLTEVELSYAQSFGMTPADYLAARNAGSNPDGS